MSGKCIIFSAPSGAGKTTILKELLTLPELKLEFSISATTRKPRKNEMNGKDYYFLPVEEFKRKISADEFIEWEEVYENCLYGTLKSEINRIWNKGNNVAFDVDVNGGLHLKKKFDDKALALFIMPPSDEVLEKRLHNRGTESDDIIQKRLAKVKFEMSFKSQFDSIIINDVLEDSIKKAYDMVLEFIREK